MTFVEAVRESFNRYDKNPNDYMWIRPVKWKGCRQAVDAIGGMLLSVPSSRPHYWNPSVAHVLADWEVVSPDVVLGEEDRISSI